MPIETPCVKTSPSVIFQSAKLGDLPLIIEELDWARFLLDTGELPSRVYGVSGGILSALAYSLSLAARQDPEKWGKAANILPVFQISLRKQPPAKFAR